MSTVYVVHEVLVDGAPFYDTSAAKNFGELKILFRTEARRNGSRSERQPDANFMTRATDSIVEGMKTFTSDDYLLTIGATSLIAAAAALAAQRTGGLLRLLIWNNRGSEYEPVETQLWPPGGDGAHP